AATTGAAARTVSCANGRVERGRTSRSCSHNRYFLTVLLAKIVYLNEQVRGRLSMGRPLSRPVHLQHERKSRPRMRTLDPRAALALAALGLLNSGGTAAETATTDGGGFVGVGGSTALSLPTPQHKAPFWSLSGEPELRSSSVVIYDPSDGAVLYERDADTVVPIASITKLMTALVVRDGEQPLDEMIEITAADRDTLRGTGSRLPIGARLSRGDLLHLALMSSENRAANALGRAYPGGLAMFVQVMNAKAKALGMKTAR